MVTQKEQRKLYKDSKKLLFQKSHICYLIHSNIWKDNSKTEVEKQIYTLDQN